MHVAQHEETILSHDEPFNVRSFGAVGDGAADDTAAIEDLGGHENTIIADNPGRLFVPPER